MAPERAALVGVMVGLFAGNFVWQAMTCRDWNRATERTWFQFIAILAVVVFVR